MHQRVLAGEVSHQGFELRFKRRNGEIFDALIYEAPLMDIADGKHFGWMASVLDITDRKRSEEFARTAAGAVAGDGAIGDDGRVGIDPRHMKLNQPLAAISSYASGCIRRPGERHAA